MATTFEVLLSSSINPVPTGIDLSQYTLNQIKSAFPGNLIVHGQKGFPKYAVYKGISLDALMDLLGQYEDAAEDNNLLAFRWYKYIFGGEYWEFKEACKGMLYIKRALGF